MSSGRRDASPKRRTARAAPKSTKAPAKATRPKPPNQQRGALGRLRFAVAGLGAVAFLFVFVFPTSSLWDQRSDVRETRDRVDLVRAEADQLQQELDRLADDEVIARLARERFHLVRPGETAWAVVPGPVTTPADAAAPDAAPTEGVDDTTPDEPPEAPPLVP